MNRIRSTALLAGVALAGGLLTAGLATPAAAGELRLAGTTHCVSAAVPVGTQAAETAPRCFTTFAAAIAYATDGAVRLPAGSTRVTQAQLDAGRMASVNDYLQPALTSVVLGISYKDTGWSGDSWVHTGSYGCDTNADVDWQNAGPLVGPGGGWDNAIGSGIAYGDCQPEYFAGSGFTGASIDSDWSGGVMNNAASSIQWR